MLEWLKTILGDAYTEDIDKKVSGEIGKGFVAKADFNELTETKKKLEGDIATRDSQLEELKKATGDTAALNTKISELQTTNATAKAEYEKQIAGIRLDNAVEKALSEAGAKNNTAVKALLSETLKDAKVGDDGSVKGLSEAIGALAKAESTAFLFNEAGNGASFSGFQPGNPGGNTPPPSGDFVTRLTEARKNGNNAEAIAIKREAAEKGVFLN